MGNLFGESAACFLARGVPHRSRPSPLVYVLTVDPIHVIARICGKGCSMYGLTPNGSSDFAILISGVNAVSSIVSLAGAFLTWMGQLVNMLKSKISAIDFANGRPVATNSIQLNGAAFPVQPLHKALKQLVVRLAMADDFQRRRSWRK
jgi:hypothetical protein